MAPTSRHTVEWLEPPAPGVLNGQRIRFRACIHAGEVEDIWVQPEGSASGTWFGLLESGIVTSAAEMLRIAGRAMVEDREQHMNPNEEQANG